MYPDVEQCEQRICQVQEQVDILSVQLDKLLKHIKFLEREKNILMEFKHFREEGIFLENAN